MAVANVYWKSAIDFRDFDISVPKFTFQNDFDRNVDGYVFDDQIRLVQVQNSPQNHSFLGTGITVNGGANTSTNITGGTLDMFVDNTSGGGFDGYILINPLIAAVTLNSVIDTVSRVDDLTFLRKMLAGADNMIFSATGVATNDYAFGAAGFDNMYGQGGADTLLGDSGNDYISGGTGRDSLVGGTQIDTLVGGDGNDILYSGSSADSLFGGTGADRISGDGGDDILEGGAGRDVFVFRANHGSDRIFDWQDNIDRIRIETNVDIGISINYNAGNAGQHARITIAELDLVIVVQNVANGSLQLSQQGDVFFLT